MTKFLATILATSFLILSGADLASASPTRNSDGSQTCTASGPSSAAADGVCANTMKKNEELCEQDGGGLSTEPGGGITCSHRLTGGIGGAAMQLRTNGSAPLHKPARR